MAEGFHEGNLEKLEVEITCAICQDHYKDPKILPCLHYYCKECILHLTLRNGADKPFSCPECRHDCLLPEDGVDELKTPFFITRLKSMIEDFIRADTKNDEDDVYTGAITSESFNLVVSKDFSTKRQRNECFYENHNTMEDESAHSDDSFKSALSELDLDCSAKNDVSVNKVHAEKENETITFSSQFNEKSENIGDNTEILGNRWPSFSAETPGSFLEPRHQPATDLEDVHDRLGNEYMCKDRIEQEEAEELAKVRSMEVQDIPHPALSGLAPPTPEVLIHVQTIGDKHNETDQASVSKPYLEGTHWIKGDLIGTGAFCSCYLARDVENGTIFAVKEVSFARNTKSQEANELSRLRDEVTLLGHINHPNIVRCLGATQYDRHINIFVEWMAGGCLNQLLHRFGHFSESVICNYTRQIANGITFLHENGILHRDLKGGNILVDSTGQRLRIADFGAAARLAAHTTGLGEFQNMEGTVAFMAPEVVKGGTEGRCGYGRKCDVWSIGCVIIQMATAKLPWLGDDKKTRFQLIFMIGQATGPPPLPNFTNHALKDFALRCLEVNPIDRPTSNELLKHPLFLNC